MSLSDEAQKIIQEEEACLDKVLNDLQTQLTSTEDRFYREARRANSLTHEIQAARKDVDKQLLASDEAVAHGVANMKRDEVGGIRKLLEKPYFARLELEETEPDGKTRKLELRLGSASNTECRIVDWRRAPLARLYYEYQEGEEYFEEILGRERSGKVLLRRKVDIQEGKLCAVSGKFGAFRKGEDQVWKESGGGSRTGAAGSYSQLPDILSLITAEQFQTITDDIDRAILIQGVAGSGKTTIALHRLAWLLHEDNGAGIRPDDCAVVVLSPSLQGYILRSLQQLGIEGVPVLTYPEWSAPTVAKVCGLKLPASGALNLRGYRPDSGTAPGVRRVLHSIAFLSVLEESVAEVPEFLAENRLQDMIVLALQKTNRILELDETKLLDRELVRATCEYIEQVHAKGCVDTLEDALLVRLFSLHRKAIYRADGSCKAYKHLVADEVQDLTSPELASLLGSLEKIQQVTLVGDTSQASRHRSPFPVWEKLQKFWSLGDSLSRFLTLSISHRSTNSIMRLAHHVQQSEASSGGRPGKPPLWYRCRNENQGVQEAIGWLERIVERFPSSLTAVLCSSEQQAKEAYNLLSPTFGPLVFRAEAGNIDYQEGILVSSIDSVKGLEFPHVMIWNPDADNYPNKDRARNLLYIAITRAEEHLCLVSWGRPSPLLPGIHSHIVRGITRADEEEEAQEEREERDSDESYIRSQK